MPPQAAEKARGACRPGRDELSIGKLQSFLPYFLCFTKSRRKKSPQGGGEAAERQKDLIGFVRSFCLCALIRGLQNLESPFGKVLILFVRSRHCGELNRGSQNLDVLCKENEFILFACTKRTKSTPEVCEPLDSGDDSNLRSIRDFR